PTCQREVSSLTLPAMRLRDPDLRFTLASQATNPCFRPFFELGMFGFLPRCDVAVQEPQQLPAPDGLARSFNQKRTAPSWADHRVDLADKILWQQDVGSLDLHSSITPEINVHTKCIIAMCL